MLVIHGIWARGALCLWAEDSRLPARPSRWMGRRAGGGPGPPGRTRSRPIPSPRGDARRLGEAAGDLARKAAGDELTLWLPSGADGPQAAPELIRPAAGRTAQPGGWPALGCWRVPALAFEPAAALGILAPLDLLAAVPAELAAGPDPS